MANLNLNVPTANLNYAGLGSGPSLTRHAGLYTEQRVTWFKGVDNLLDITVSGNDRRPVSLLNRELVITMWDSTTKSTIFRRRVMATVPENGQARLTIFARDLMTLSPGLYHLGATFIDANGLEVALTWNRAQQGAFDVEVKDAVVPTTRSTVEVTEWTLSNSIYVSSAVNGPLYYRKDTGMFTVALYASNFTGSVIIQGTLDDVVTGTTLWSNLKPQDADSATLTLTGYTGIDPYNFYGNVRWLRTVRNTSLSNAGTLDKVLIRV